MADLAEDIKQKRVIKEYKPFVDKSLENYHDETQIWNLFDLVEKQLKEFGDISSKFPSDFQTVIEKGAFCDFKHISNVYKSITSEDASLKGNLAFRKLVKFIFVWQILQKRVIEPQWYPLIIEVANILNQNEKFRINAFAITVTNILLAQCQNSELNFQEMAEAFRFAHTLHNKIKNRYRMILELSFLLSILKCRIYDKILEPTEEKFKDAIECVLLAESHYADVAVLKDSLKLSISQWKGLGKLKENIDSEALNKPCEIKPFVENKEDVESQDILISLSDGYINAKIDQIIYMTNQDFVQVSIWKAIVIKQKSNDSEGDQFIAIKECSSHTLDKLKGYFEEAEVLKALSGVSKNFLQFYSARLQESTLGENKQFVFTIQMEYVESTLKNDKIKRDTNKKPYNQFEILSIYKQLILAFNLMRELNILHCDIKPSNIMITNDFVIKIIDFNTAKIGIDDKTMQVGAVGTKDFMSPEIRAGYDSNCPVSMKEDKADVFSLGLTILSLVTNKPIVDLNLEKNKPVLLEIINSINFEWLKSTLMGMLEFDYTKRLGLKDLISKFPEDASVTAQT